MKFCEFLKLMGKYFGKEHKSQAALLSSICGWFINDKQEVFKNETDPILNEITDSSNRPKVSNIFTGKKPLDEYWARVLFQNFDKTDFVSSVFDDCITEDTTSSLVKELCSAGFLCTEDNARDVISSLYKAFLEAAIEKKAEVNPPTVNVPTPSIQRKTGDEIEPGTTRVPSHGAEVRDGYIYLDNGKQRIKIPSSMAPQKGQDELPYIRALLDAYSDKEKKEISLSSLLEKNSICSRHFRSQRDAFYCADCLRHNLRNMFSDGEEEFQKLESDAYDGIEPAYDDFYDNGYDRLQAVLNKVTDITLHTSLSRIENLYGNKEKKGLCHMMVNDGKIKSWVIDDAENL